MKVSVVVCTYAEEIFDHFQAAIESIRAQTHENFEIIAVVDGNDSLYHRIKELYADTPEVTIHNNEENVGLSRSRNNALEYVTGDIVAFLDDDAVADERWLEELVHVFEMRDAIAVGGKMTPIWLDGEPQFLPEEFYWLVGVTYPGFADPGEEVRNTFGSNISFRTEILTDLGGFEEEIGRKGEQNLQSEETLLGARMREEYGRGVIYNPDAKVGHKIFDYRTRRTWLLNRAFWQGYSKHVMKGLVAESGGAERDFLEQVLGRTVPGQIGTFLRSPSIERADRLVMVFLLTAAVGIGYLYAIGRQVLRSTRAYLGS